MDVEHHFTLGPAGDELWSPAEEERRVSLIRGPLLQPNGRGSGIYIRPVREGMEASGSSEAYGFDGWAVGEFGEGGARDLAVGPWLDQVVEAARSAAS